MVRKPPTWLRPEILTVYTIDHGPGEPVETFEARDYEDAANELFSRLPVDDSDGPWTLAAKNQDGDKIRVVGWEESTGIGDECVLILESFLNVAGLSGGMRLSSGRLTEARFRTKA